MGKMKSYPDISYNQMDDACKALAKIINNNGVMCVFAEASEGFKGHSCRIFRTERSDFGIVHASALNGNIAARVQQILQTVFTPLWGRRVAER